MGRPRKAKPARRYHLTLEPNLAERIDSYATAVRKRPATAAAQLLQEAVCRVDAGEATTQSAERGGASRQAGMQELTRVREYVTELEGRVAQLRMQLSQQQREVEASQPPVDDGDQADDDAAGITPHDRNGDGMPRRGRRPRPAPRWEWPLKDILADDSWWDRWLPRLYELLGNDLHDEDDRGYGFHGEPVHDRRGYSDLMSYLFPPIDMGDRLVGWRSMGYAAAASWAARQRRGEQRSALYEDGPYAWEAVIRHVVEALCALEMSGVPGADPYVRLRAKAEIVGPWVAILRHLVGEEAPRLPHKSGKGRQLVGTIPPERQAT